MAGDSLNSVFGRKLAMAIALSLASALPASSVYAEHIPDDRCMVDGQPFTLRADSVREVSLFAPNSSFRIDVVGAVKHGPQRMGDDNAWWGITLLDTEGRERMAVRLLCGTEPYDATFSRPYLRVVVDSVSAEGRRFPVAERQLFNGVETYKGFNGLRVAYGDYKVLVAVGSEFLLTAAGFPYDTPLASASIGGNRSVDVRYVEVWSEPSRSVPLGSGWPVEDIKAYTAESRGVEGIWEFLDRDTNARLAEPGGAYRLAVVPHRHTPWCGCPSSASEPGPGGAERPAGATDANALYDIIYLGGARIYGKYWSPGMVKGRMFATGFENHYALQWFDSDMLPVGTEISADFTAPSLLSFNFPLLKSTLRFSRR